MSFTITSALRWWWREAPDQVALNIDGAELTFRELYDWSRGAAVKLRELGVRPGQRIGVLADQAHAYYALATGAQFIGAIASPLNTRFTPRELTTALDDTTPSILFADAGHHRLAEQVAAARGGPAVHFLEEAEGWREPPAEEIDHRPGRNDVVVVMCTSGSTAKPKFVTFTHDMIVAYGVEQMLMEPTARRGKTILFAPPFSGGLYTVYKHLVIGSTMYLLSRFDAEQAIELTLKEKINIFPMSPVFLERMQATPQFKDADLSFITWASVGGARVSPALVKTWGEKGVKLRSMFGQTEAGGAWCATDTALRQILQAGCGGPFTTWKVMNDGKFAEPGEVGEIVIEGPTVTVGYWDNPEATAQILKDGWLHTGDLGVLDEIGSLTFVDRMKDIIISGGLNISAAEVEAVVAEVPGVEEVAVIAAKDPRFDETPMAVVWGSGPIEPMSIIAHCNLNLSNYKVPRYVAVETEPLPRTATGKISKPALRERHADAHQRLPKLR